MGLCNKYKKQEQPMIGAIHDVGNKTEKLANENKNAITLVPIRSMPTSMSASALKPITQYTTTSLGPTMTKYFNNRDDKVFGIYGEKGTGKNYIGYSKVNFVNDNLIINGNKYEATEGLMWLLTQSKTPPNNLVKPDDMLNYKTILFDRNAFYQNSDPNTRRPKSSTGAKYNNIIETMWDRRKWSGSGMRMYTELPIVCLDE
jgi:hypothetical protein